jgi:predicted transcriptional regulator
MVRTPRPTESELAILRVLWDKGPSTVRQVNDVLSASRDTGYTTTLKLMQIMAEKGLVTRDERDRTHVYAARSSQAQTQNQLVSDLVDRAFGGSAAALVLHALRANSASPEELSEIERLIDAHKRGKTGKPRKTSGDHNG